MLLYQVDSGTDTTALQAMQGLTLHLGIPGSAHGPSHNMSLITADSRLLSAADLSKCVSGCNLANMT